MAYALRYHPRVLDEDLEKLSTATKDPIARSIGARLTEHPERSGVPLKGSLRGHWKLRVGDHRLVFRVRSAEVWILAIMHRRDVYVRAERRSR